MVGEQSGLAWPQSSSWPNGREVPRFDLNFGAGCLGTGRGMSTAGPQAYAIQFSSTHSSVVQFAMGDGSVRGLRPGASETLGSSDKEPSTSWNT